MTNEVFISDVICSMVGVLDTEQLSKLKETMIMKMHNKEITEICTSLSTMTIAETNQKMLNSYYADMVVNKKSKKTIDQYIRHTVKVLDFINKPYNEINKDDLLYFYVNLQNGKAFSQNTLINYRKYVKPFFKWLTINGYIPSNPFDRIGNIKPVEVKKIVLTDKEIENMRDVCKSVRELALLDFLLCTGMRVGELCSLSINDIDFNNETVDVYATKTKTHRTLPLSAKAVKHLADYRNSLDENKLKSDSLFLSTRKSAISQKSVETLLQSIADRANVKKHITVHTFRKTLATQLYSKKCPTNIITYILGHKDFSTTARHYCKFDDLEARYEFHKYIS